MPDLSEVKARHKLELRVAELEDELVSLKKSGKTPDRLRSVKNELRQLRQESREARDVAGPGTATPSTIRASASVKEN
jgi:hypothetical protein